MKKNVLKISVAILGIVVVAFLLILTGFKLTENHLTRTLKLTGLEDVSRSTFFTINVNNTTAPDTHVGFMGLNGYAITSDELSFIEREKLFAMLEDLEPVDITVDNNKNYWNEYDMVISFDTTGKLSEKPSIAFINKTTALTPTPLFYDKTDNNTRFQHTISEKKFDKIFATLYSRAKEISVNREGV